MPPLAEPEGITHLILDPLDFLRRLAALVSLPYTHQVRYHGPFFNHSRWRRSLPPHPPRTEEAQAMLAAQVPEPATTAAPRAQGPPSGRSRKRTSWAQLLPRVPHVDSLACPRRSLPGRPVPMVVLAFLLYPEVVVKILKHLGCPPAPPLRPPP